MFNVAKLVLAFEHLSSTRSSIPSFVLKNNTFGPRSRYRKILLAAAANQIAGNEKISLEYQTE